MKSFTVNNLKENILLSKYVLNKYQNLSRNVFFKALRNKDIKVNNKRVSCDLNLNNLDRVEIYISDELIYNLPKKIDVIYEDENILIVFKPQGILSNEEDKSKESLDYEPTLEDLVQKQFGKFYICHRLDRNTAGLVIFSKNLMVYDLMSDAFKNSKVNKNYMACVYGILNKKHDILNQYIMPDKKNGYSKIYDSPINGAQNVITEYNVLNENKTSNISILDIKIHTGKTHQIRAQLKSINHPIIGDSKYGKNEINKKFRKYRQLLVAYKYSFNFEQDSLLSYLNNLIISLPEKYIRNILNVEI